MTFVKSISKRAIFAAMGATIASAAFSTSADAQQAKAPTAPRGWFKVCTKQEDNDVCIVQNLKQASNGQLLTAVGLINVTGKVNRKIMQVSVPSARAIPPGIMMQIDGGKGQKIDYAVCMPDKCIAEVPLTDGMVSSMKKGGEVVFTSVNFQRAPNPIKISLTGFTDAYDGAPMEQSKLEETQRALQEKALKEAEERRKKLEEAQKAAKSE